MKENLLITGATGFLGENISSELKKSYNLYYIFNKSIKKNIRKDQYTIVNLKKFTNIRKFVLKHNIRKIVHCAGLTDIELCQKYPKKCLNVNYKYTKDLAKIAKNYDILFVFISSDHLFDGKKKFYSEKSKTRPQNNYSKSKIKSEQYIKNTLKKYLIIRTNFFGYQKKKNKKNFFNFIYKRLKKKKKIHLFHDVYFTPVSVNTFSNILNNIIKKKIYGTFNISCDDRISKYKFGRLISKVFNLDSNLVNKISIYDLKLVKRPLNMSLTNSKIKKKLSIKKISILDEIKKIKKTFK